MKKITKYEAGLYYQRVSTFDITNGNVVSPNKIYKALPNTLDNVLHYVGDDGKKTRCFHFHERWRLVEPGENTYNIY